MTYIDAIWNKILFLWVVSRAPIFHLQRKKGERLAGMAFPTRKAVLGTTCLTWDAGWLAACHDWASCFCHARAIKLSIPQPMRHLPMTRLQSPLAQRSPACTAGLLLGQSGPDDSAASRTWGSSKKQFRCQWSACSNDTLAHHKVLGRLACSRTKLANPPSEGSCENGSLSAFLSWNVESLSLP